MSVSSSKSGGRKQTNETVAPETMTGYNNKNCFTVYLCGMSRENTHTRDLLRMDDVHNIAQTAPGLGLGLGLG